MYSRDLYIQREKLNRNIIGLIYTQSNMLPENKLRQLRLLVILPQAQIIGADDSEIGSKLLKLRT